MSFSSSRVATVFNACSNIESDCNVLDEIL